MPAPPHSKYAARFLIVGAVMTFGLTALMTIKGPFSGMGDGTGYTDTPPGVVLVLPYAAYFVGGFIAAGAPQRGVRILAAIMAHLVPWLIFIFANSHDSSPFIFIYSVTFAAFAYIWFQLLKKDDDGADRL